MAKAAVSQWDTTASSNTEINSIPIDGAVTTPSQVDNLFREVLLGDLVTGLSGVQASSIVVNEDKVITIVACDVAAGVIAKLQNPAPGMYLVGDSASSGPTN